MKMVKLSALAFAMIACVGCGGASGKKGGTGGTIIGRGGNGVGTGGAGGSINDANLPSDVGIDRPVINPDIGPGVDLPAIDAGPTSSIIDCTGLTSTQCHDRIINPPTFPDSVLAQDPGANPVLGYPACSSS
jgi:hypothetical protein